jgi:hypothetical protein
MNIEYIVQFSDNVYLEIHNNSCVNFSANIHNGKRYHFLIDSETIYKKVSLLPYNTNFEKLVLFLEKESFLFSNL